MTRQRLRESSRKMEYDTFYLDSFALKIVKKSEELAFSNKAKIINLSIPEKVKALYRIKSNSKKLIILKKI